ncbi:MAG: ribosome biogenesis GTP-binding protein YihA/YsxC [Acidobacteriota bacterium]
MPEIAFVGRSNVGKSSLMNRLLGRRGLARTSRSPGRTRLVNYFVVNRRFYFVDLPGYGYARASRGERQRWAELMDEYFQRGVQQDGLQPSGGFSDRLLVQLIDAKVGATELDQQAFEYFTSLDLALLLVATKVDKLPRSRRVRSLKGIHSALQLPEEVEIVPCSATSGEGVKQVWQGISLFLSDCTKKPQPVEMT